MLRYRRLFRTFNIFGKMEREMMVDHIKLLPQEQKIFDILREAAQTAEKPVVMRVAGGWVRDKVKSPYTSCLERSLWTLTLPWIL